MSDSVSPFLSGDVDHLRTDAGYVRANVLSALLTLTDAEIVYLITQLNIVQSFVSDSLSAVRIEMMRREQSTGVPLQA